MTYRIWHRSKDAELKWDWVRDKKRKPIEFDRPAEALEWSVKNGGYPLDAGYSDPCYSIWRWNEEENEWQPASLNQRAVPNNQPGPEES